MILGYKKQFPWGKPTDFKRKILVEVKRHTIREDIHDRWRAGLKIQHAHGVRTKQYEQFSENECTRTQRIYIGKTSTKNEDLCYNYNGINYGIIVDKKRLTNYQIGYLAFYDGFDSTDDFFHWFCKGFKGKLIHWSNLRY
jgi:hypothetical protein